MIFHGTIPNPLSTRRYTSCSVSEGPRRLDFLPHFGTGEGVPARLGIRHGERTRVLLKPQKTHGREGTMRHQRIISIVAFVALLLALLPSAAFANSLLSGYGGPGEGNQAILGSALLNAPKGGGGGGASAGQSSSSQPTETSATQTGGSSGTSKQGSSTRRTAHARSGKHATAGGKTSGSTTSSVIYPASSREVTTGGSRTLGLSGADLAYIILALGVLALTGFLTLRLTRATATRESDARP